MGEVAGAVAVLGAPVTVRSALVGAGSRLGAAGCETPRLDAGPQRLRVLLVAVERSVELVE